CIVDERHLASLNGVDEHASKLPNSTGEAVSVAILPDVLNAPAGIDDDGKSAGAQQRQRLQGALGRVRKSEKFLVEDTVEIQEEKRIGPARRPGCARETGGKVVHRIDKKISGFMMPRVVSLGIFAQGDRIERMPHDHRAVQDFVKQNAIRNGCVAGFLLVYP